MSWRNLQYHPFNNPLSLPPPWSRSLPALGISAQQETMQYPLSMGFYNSSQQPNTIDNLTQKRTSSDNETVLFILADNLYGAKKC